MTVSERDDSQALQQEVLAAIERRTPLRLVGGGTKAFYGESAQGRTLDVASHRGIVSYEPTELVITARAGTPLAEIESALFDQGQMLPFEPPHFGEGATLGGTIACGFSGPRRPYAGAARDFVLGVVCLNGKGERLRFGGQVMKNVAGYDISRLMVGALGTLGILLDISLKVLPRPECERSLVHELDAAQAITVMNDWAGKPVPLSAACHHEKKLHLRLSGSEKAVTAAVKQIGGATDPEGTDFWTSLREQRLRFFEGLRPLWRVCVMPAAPPLALDGECLLDWGGAQRWFRTDAPAASLRAQAEMAGGHALLFRRGNRDDAVFHPLPAAMQNLHRRLKDAFDPYGLFNPGRMCWQR